MDQQEQRILQAIAVSSSQQAALTSPQDRQAAFQILQDLKNYPARVPICLNWLQSENPIRVQLANSNNNTAAQDITVATKLLALELLQSFLQKGYAQASDQDRLAIRQGVLKSCRLLALQAASQQQQQIQSGGGIRILARKFAVLLEGLIVRDFPQRWTTLATDLFSPLAQGGLWDEVNDNNTGNQSLIGVKICLECFRLVAEDCTDSDFNAKISTTRRNDVLIGLNELADGVFLPLFFQLLERAFPALQNSKAALHSMNQYLISQGRTTYQMTPEESQQYRAEEKKIDNLGRLLFDTLKTLEIFCANLPSTWMLGASGDNNNLPKLDFVAAMMHLMRVPDSNVQVKAVECLEQLTLRGKLEIKQWMRLVTDLPVAFQEAHQILSTAEAEYRRTMSKANGEESPSDGNSNNLEDAQLVLQLGYHRALSRTLSTVISSHLGHITSDKDVIQGKGSTFQKVSNFLALMVSMLHHPSGRILTEQIALWVSLFRDPQISKSNFLLHPFVSEVMSCYMDHLIKIRWEDVENEVHPQSTLLEAIFDDEEDYNDWLNDLRSRSSLLFKFIGNTEPALAANILCTRLQDLLSKYGNGDPFDHVDSSNNQLTQQSEAVMQLEAFCQPLDNTLGGIPSWAMESENSQTNYTVDDKNRNRAEIRANTRAALSEMASAIVQWKPTYLWLKFRHATLLESLKHYWKHDPSTLLQGVDTFIRYLGLSDEWKAGHLSQSNYDANGQLSGEITSLKKRSGTALVSVAKRVPHHLVPWLSQLSEATKNLLSSDVGLIPTNQMHLYEFLSCVATAVNNPLDRSNFIADVLSDAVATLESSETIEQFSSTASLFNVFGVTQARDRPESVTDPANVQHVTTFYNRAFTALNRLLSVGRRCSEASRKRSVLGGLPIDSLPPNNSNFGGPGQPIFPPDEGPMSISDLAINDPFVPLWPRILPSVLQIYEVTLGAWRPENQAAFLPDKYQRYVFAISDDEVYLSKTQNTKGGGGVFGEGGTAGSVVSGTDRRDVNLVPKWSGWFNELRNTCFQLIGLMIGQRAIFAPEVSNLYPRLVSVLVDPMNLKSMEHRHLTQFLKHVFELMLICCPCSLYKTHLEPIASPIFEHMRYRLDKTWLPVLGGAAVSNYNSNMSATKALTSGDCSNIGTIVSRGEEEWFSWYYSHAGLFVGDLDATTAEAAVEKYRVEISRTFSDVMQSALALKGEWALVLANLSKEEQAIKRNDASKLTSGPKSRFNDEGIQVNADGTPKLAHQAAIDARKLLRINSLCHFLLLESESIAGNLTLTITQCLCYPDAYTCRRITKICHRVLETVAWSPTYSQLLGQHLFTQAVKNLVTEPKWMVGIEWDMITIVRDIYCRLVLGQVLQTGGQGPGLQQANVGGNKNHYEQAKTANQPLQGGGILETASDYPRQILVSLPGITASAIEVFETQMKTKMSAKDQKDCIRDLLRTASDNLNELNPSADDGNAAAGIFDRAVKEESLLHATKRPSIPDLPEKLVTKSQVDKAAKRHNEEHPIGMGAFSIGL